MTYSEIKTTLKNQPIPRTLDGKYIYYSELQGTIDHYISHVDGCIAKGYDPRNCRECKRSKKHLLLICEQLENKEAHNQPRPIPKLFINKY